MTKTMSDLTEDLVAEILSRVPITSLGAVRSTCKGWNALSRQRIFGEVAKAKNQILGFMVKDYKICSVRINLQRINNIGDDSIDLSIKHVNVLTRIKVHSVYQCDGLLLCRLADMLLIWNPYLGQRRWIQHIFDSFCCFALGYDNNRNHKILQILGFGFKIYEFSSDSWRVLDVTPKWKISILTQSVTLKGNPYFYAGEKIIMDGGITETKVFLVCFDFTSDKFGPRLSLPFHSSSVGAVLSLSCVRDNQIAMLCQRWQKRETTEIWVTKKIDYNKVLWTKWMELDMNMLTNSPLYLILWSIFIDEENRVAVVFNKCCSQRVHIVGQDGYFKSIDLGEASIQAKLDFIGYFPSLVQIE